MSDSYTHKIICFSEKDYSGDAFVVMASTIKQDNKRIDLKKIYSNGVMKFNSVIVQKGCWSFGYDERNTRYNCARHLNDEKVYTNSFFHHDMNHRTDWLAPVLTSSHLIPPNDGPKSKATHAKGPYTLKFYPKDNAFMISPSPAYCMDKNESINGEPEEFRWIFQDGDELKIEWEGDDVEHAYLEFKSLDHSVRCLPISYKVGEEVVDPNELVDNPSSNISEIKNFIKGRYDLAKPGKTITIKCGVDNHRWSFDFCCIIGEKHYRVDPEGKVRTGSN